MMHGASSTIAAIPAIALSAAAAATVNADVVWDYGPRAGAHNGGFSNMSDDQNFVEQIVFEQDTIIDRMDIWTCWNDPPPTIKIKIYVDDGAGTPGDLDASWEQPMDEFVDEGPELIRVTAFFDDAVTLSAGTIYWIGLSGVGSELGQEAVQTPGDGMMAQMAGDGFQFHTSVGDQMFRLYGEPAGGGGIPGDIDGDGTVGTSDLVLLLGAWGECDDCADCPEDLDDDCSVGTTDLLTLLGNWG